MEMNAEKAKVLRIPKHPSLIQIMIDKKQSENVEYFSYFGSRINDARYTREVKSRIATTKAVFIKKKNNKTLFNQQIG